MTTITDKLAAALCGIDECIATATKLRAAFGDKTMRDLSELFEGV